VRIPVRNPLNSARPARGALLAAMMAVVAVGLVLANQADSSKGSELLTGGGEEATGAAASDQGLQLNELADGALASAGPALIGRESDTATSVASQVDEVVSGPAGASDPAAPSTAITIAAVAQPAATEPPTTRPATTKPPTRPSTTRPPTTKPPTTVASPSDPTEPPTTVVGDPGTADTAAVDPTDSTEAPAHPAGYVDAGHGVWLPEVMISIRRCESHDNYTAVNASSGASGAYQFLNSSWAGYGFAAIYGVKSAKLATPAQQDEAALATYERSGTSPWKASRSCWG
jgi:Transglycosylase-like domain